MKATTPGPSLAGRALWRRNAVALEARLHREVALFGRAGISADEERPAAFRLDPVGEFVGLAIERVEQHDAADAVAGAAVGQRKGGGQIAAAIGDEDDRHAAERGARRCGIERGELGVRLVEELRRSAPGCQKLPALESRASTAICGAISTRVETGLARAGAAPAGDRPRRARASRCCHGRRRRGRRARWGRNPVEAASSTWRSL